jgi:hypothetical protein
MKKSTLKKHQMTAYDKKYRIAYCKFWHSTVILIQVSVCYTLISTVCTPCAVIDRCKQTWANRWLEAARRPAGKVDSCRIMECGIWEVRSAIHRDLPRVYRNSTKHSSRVEMTTTNERVAERPNSVRDTEYPTSDSLISHLVDSPVCYILHRPAVCCQRRLSSEPPNVR